MSQIEKKGIKNDAVDGTKIRLLNNQSIRARNAANDGDVDLVKVNGDDDVEFPSLPLFGGSPIATQGFVASEVADAIAVATEGLLPKDAVRASTTAALPACTYDNGASGVGATLTGDANGALAAQDGVTLVADDRLLVQHQVDAFENGIFVVTDPGDGSNPFVLTRATDFDDSPDGEIRVGARTYVYEGSTQIGKAFVVTTPGDIVVGTDDIEFGLYGSSTSAVESVNGQTGVVVLDTGDIAEDGNLYFTTARARTAAVADAINNGTVDIAPSQNAVFDALALKQDASTAVTSVNSVTPTGGNVALDTDDLPEGGNLYFTTARARTAAVADAINNGTTDIAPSQNAVFDALALKQNSLNSGAEQLTLNGTDITNQYKDLAQIAINGSLVVVAFGIVQTQGVDYTLSIVSSKTRITFAGDLATGGAAELISGDKLNVQYLY